MQARCAQLLASRLLASSGIHFTIIGLALLDQSCDGAHSGCVAWQGGAWAFCSLACFASRCKVVLLVVMLQAAGQAPHPHARACGLPSHRPSAANQDTFFWPPTSSPSPAPTPSSTLSPAAERPVGAVPPHECEAAALSGAAAGAGFGASPALRVATSAASQLLQAAADAVTGGRWPLLLADGCLSIEMLCATRHANRGQAVLAAGQQHARRPPPPSPTWRCRSQTN